MKFKHLLKSISKYYKGNLRCEFQTFDIKKVGNSSVYTKQSKILLEPRFRFDEVESISEEEYLDAIKVSPSPFIKRSEISDVEFSFKNSTDSITGSSLIKIQEIILFLNNSDKEYDDQDQYVDSSLLAHFIKEEKQTEKNVFHSYDKKSDYADFKNKSLEQINYYSPFNAYDGKSVHGKIKGFAYCKEVQLLDEKNKPLSQDQIKETEKKKLEETVGFSIPEPIRNKGCFGKPISSRIIDFGNLGSVENGKGCFGNSTPSYFSSVLYGGGSSGCFGRRTANGGCFPMFSSNRTGCMFPLILLLLGSLLWNLFNMRGCQQNSTPPPVIIHDTIKVEVQKIDTLTIVKTDTVSYVDSTVKMNYETVNLPNVQFITNSDVLLPSSASDLQKLAEYLIKNDSLNATILGHTDNVGNSSDNLKLSQRRAESVKKFLSSLGVKESRLKAVGKGDTNPKADNRLEEGRLMNRRVEVQLTNTEVITTTRTRKEEENSSKKNKN